MRTQQIGKQKQRRPVPECRKCSHFRARKAAPFLYRGFLSRRMQKGERSTFCCPIYRIDGSTSTMIRVHCSAFTSQFFVNSAAAAPAPGAALAISFFIIAPQKKGVNPKAKFCKDFYGVLQKQNTLLRVAAHREGCFAWILPWCEEESCYLGSGCGPASHGKSITAFTIHFVKKL